MTTRRRQSRIPVNTIPRRSSSKNRRHASSKQMKDEESASTLVESTVDSTVESTDESCTTEHRARDKGIFSSWSWDDTLLRIGARAAPSNHLSQDEEDFLCIDIDKAFRRIHELEDENKALKGRLIDLEQDFQSEIAKLKEHVEQALDAKYAKLEHVRKDLAEKRKQLGETRKPTYSADALLQRAARTMATMRDVSSADDEESKESKQASDTKSMPSSSRYAQYQKEMSCSYLKRTYAARLQRESNNKVASMIKSQLIAMARAEEQANGGNATKSTTIEEERRETMFKSLTRTQETYIAPPKASFATTSCDSSNPHPTRSKSNEATESTPHQTKVLRTEQAEESSEYKMATTSSSRRTRLPTLQTETGSRRSASLGAVSHRRRKSTSNQMTESTPNQMSELRTEGADQARKHEQIWTPNTRNTRLPTLKTETDPRQSVPMGDAKQERRKTKASASSSLLVDPTNKSTLSSSSSSTSGRKKRIVTKTTSKRADVLFSPPRISMPQISSCSTDDFSDQQSCMPALEPLTPATIMIQTRCLAPSSEGDAEVLSRARTRNLIRKTKSAREDISVASGSTLSSCSPGSRQFILQERVAKTLEAAKKTLPSRSRSKASPDSFMQELAFSQLSKFTPRFSHSFLSPLTRGLATTETNSSTKDPSKTTKDGSRAIETKSSMGTANTSRASSSRSVKWDL